MVYVRKQQIIQTELDLKQNAEETRHALIKKARDFWDVTRDVTKMTNKQLISILMPLRKTEEPTVPSIKTSPHSLHQME